MVSFINSALMGLCLALTTTAAPSEDIKAAAANTGSVTYYEVGLGACGQTNSNSEYVVAVSAPLFDSQRPCDRNIRVSYEGRSATVKVVDRCTGCAENDLDLSPTVFQEVIGDLGIGRATASWEWA